jgi:hypothetical protein
MKTKKSLLVVPAIALVIAILAASIFIACSNGGGGGGGRQDNSSGSVRFNLTGAKAIAAAQGGAGSGRAVNGSGNGLFKLLENDSFESIVSGNYEIPPIRFLARSPVEGKKDIYINFWDGRWGNGGGRMDSTLVHVKEDGSVVNILESWDPSIETEFSWFKDNGTSPVAFDSYGNMYFRVRVSNNSNSIYKYNPVTGKKEQFVPADPNIYYGKIVVSSDGSFLIVDGDRYRSNGDLDESFVRIIPTANPQNMVEQITVRWDEGDGSNGQEGEAISLAYAFGRRNELYVSGEKIFDDENKNGFYKVSFESLSPNEWQWKKLFDAQENSYNFGSISILFVASDNSIWGENNAGQQYNLAKFINSNGQPNFYQINKWVMNNWAGESKFKSSASHFYFIGSESFEEAFTSESVYRVSCNNPTSTENVLSGITTRNTNNMLVFKYDIGGDYLYFSAVENPYIVDHMVMGDYFAGKINLTTFEYTELEFSWNITALVAY